jgi:hypothetical protein
MKFRTTSKVTAYMRPGSYTYAHKIPAGTEVVPVKDGEGRTLYAVKDALRFARNELDRHDLAHRYLFVPSEYVEECASERRPDDETAHFRCMD